MVRKRIVVIAAVVVILAAAALIGLRVYQVNAGALRIPTEHYQMGEWIDLSDTILDSKTSEFPGYSIKVDGAKVVSYNEYIEKHGIDKQKVEPGLDEKSVIDLEVEVKNVDNDKGGIPLMSLLLIPDRKNGYYIWNDDLWVQSEPNSKDMMFLALKPNSEYTTHLPYTRNIFDGAKGAFEKPIDDTHFSLVVANVPTRKVIDVVLKGQ